MATAEFLNPRVETKSELSAGAIVEKVFQALASLKLTVALLAMAVFIVLAGTMAQVEKDIWEVIDLYFRCAIAWIPLQIFFPPAFFPSKPQVPGGFWFPGGWLIGAAMAVNLVAAHGLRFKVQASGSRLWGGVGVLALGALTTWLVVASGSSASGVQSEGWLSWDSLWWMFKLGLTVCFLGSVRWMTWSHTDEHGHSVPMNRVTYWTGITIAVLLGATTFYLWVQGRDAQLDASSMRILWQLIKGTIAGLVLLAGCVMVFKKRAGVVLVHGGIGLMMFSELLVGLTAVESQIALQEGEQTNFARDIRNFELAVVTPAEGDQETHTVVAGPRLLKGFAAEQLDKEGKVAKEAVPGAKVAHDALPFDVQVVSYFKNADIRRLQTADKEKNLATAGIGTTWIVEETRASAGTDSDSKVDYPAAYVKLTKKGTNESLGTHLVSVLLSEEGITDSVEVDGKKYDLSLRFTRHYKPYTVELIDVRKDDYIGTDTPRNYSSDIHLTDAQAGTDLKYHVWMNNPLRYAGETFYQSGYHKAPTTGIEGTSLQLVTNTGWMIPYVACMIVAVGLLAHFTITLLRFLDRRQREPVGVATKMTSAPRGPAQGVAYWLPILAVAGLGLWVASKAKSPTVKPDEFDIAAFGQIPIVADGRVKPIDTYARNTLRILSGSETFYLEDKDDPKKKSLQPAIRWLLDVIARPEEGLRHKFIRIDNLDTIEALGLKNRKGFRYAPLEYMKRDDEKGKELMDTRLGKAFTDANKAREKNPRELTVAERKLIDFDRKHSLLDTLSHFARTPESDPQTPQLGLLTAFDYQMALKQAKMPLVIPPRSESDTSEGKENWKPYSLAAFLEPIEEKPEHGEWAETIVGLLDRMKGAPGVEPRRLRWAQSAKEWLSSEYAIGEDGQSQSKPRDANPAVAAWKKILETYAAGDAKGFNASVARYRESLGQRDLKEVSMSKVGFESFFNHFQPFMLSAMVYFFAFLAAVTSWLNWERTLSRTAFAMICLGLVVHTFAMVARIYISGRPPVTNLYSSAVFIGWGTVVLGMVMEAVFRNGIGNVVASATGFGALLISHYLAGDGDTFTVLQAVLDTQFWLATHVTTINLGYAVTFLAGALGVVYVLRGFFSRSLTPEIEKNLARMIYGTLCFGIFFSFVGTVLGGLWADDSWGRFWGWDPKENGALIILLWTALVLHARWDGLVKDRGMAVLAIAGNITTSWSWFGVNELGVGLHSYGFTEGVLLALGLFVLSQLVVIVIGCLPKDSWASFRGNAAAS